MANIRICNKCGKIGLDQYDFYIRWRPRISKYYYSTICKSCKRQCKKQYYQKNKEQCKQQSKQQSRCYKRKYKRHMYNDWVIFLKKLGYNSCSKCGYNKCFQALDFHHTDPESKDFGIGSFMSYTFNKKNKQILLNEVNKCIVLCANCHRELHWGNHSQ